MTQGELANVRELLSDVQILNFLRAADGMKDRPTTVLMVNQALNNGRTLDGVLCENPEERLPPRYRFIKTFSVERLGAATFRIRFGGASKNLGDGGTWCVEYGPDGEVTHIAMEDYWSK